MATKTHQLLAYELQSINMIDSKIREVGQYWRYIENIKISYSAGMYRLEFLARELREAAT